MLHQEPPLSGLQQLDGSGASDLQSLTPLLEQGFMTDARPEALRLRAQPALMQTLLDRGVGSEDAEGGVLVRRTAFHQLPEPWLPAPQPPFVEQFVLSQGRRHPQRPAKTQGVVYRRHIPWLDQTLEFRTIDAERDLSDFSRWMNDPVVAEFWQEEGDHARHRAYIETLALDPHTQGLIASLGGRPFGYFEVYWAKEDRIAPFYDAHDYDRGWHVLIGEPAWRGRQFLSAWMPSISHYLFLNDTRTRRIVIEPRADNRKMLKSLSRCGYALLKEFDFPHKRAMLGMLLRERFFGEALWIPQSEPSTIGERP